MLTACAYYNGPEPYPKYQAGDVIRIRSGFYYNCVGVLTGYRIGIDNVNDRNRLIIYKIEDLSCRGTDISEGIEENGLNIELVK